MHSQDQEGETPHERLHTICRHELMGEGHRSGTIILILVERGVVG